tara:strand:- start:233 stop:463 length:231 start_codon:yes stop_codon:yes gene_type:complete
MSWINPGMWSTLNVGWATNVALKADGVPQEERIEKIKAATGLDNMLPKWLSYGKSVGFAIIGILIYVVYKRLCKYC